ncbi:MAG: amino acid synthesis family protein [Rhizobiaceae bacterium]|nr:amino acid synthesis family protein [Rhizobiaceae bacterium]
MPEVDVRKMQVQVEEVFHEGGPRADIPVRRGAVIAIITNPFAGRYVEDIQPFMEDLKPLGAKMARKLLDALGGDASKIEGYGKGAVVGTAGELEHGALWHNPGGYAMRDLLGAERSRAIVPSTKKVGGPGTRIDIPITHTNASYVRSHFDAIEVGVADGPRAGELMLVLAMTTGPRIHSRSGGLEASQISGKDGLR